MEKTQILGGQKISPSRGRDAKGQGEKEDLMDKKDLSGNRVERQANSFETGNRTVEVRKFLEIISEQAARCAALLPQDVDSGCLQLSYLAPDTPGMAVSRFAISDIDGMTRSAVAAAAAGQNVYVEGRTVSREVRGNCRGGDSDTVFVFALVIDTDAYKEGQDPALEIAASLKVQSSPGSSHQWLFFDKPMPWKQARDLGARLRSAAAADGPTGKISTPFRVAGTPNHPSKDKREKYGRTVCDTLILQCGGVLWSAENMEALFPPVEHHAAIAATEGSDQIDGIDARIIERALQAVPNCPPLQHHKSDDCPGWLGILWGCSHAAANASTPEIAAQIEQSVKTWSDQAAGCKGAKLDRGDKQFKRIWKDAIEKGYARTEGRGMPPITVASLFQYATEKGWPIDECPATGADLDEWMIVNGYSTRGEVDEANGKIKHRAAQIRAKFGSRGQGPVADTKGGGALVLSQKAYFTNAKEFMKRNYLKQDEFTLLHHQATFYKWTGTHYAEVPVEEMKSDVWHFLAEAQSLDTKGKVIPYDPNNVSVANTFEALAAHGQLQGKIKFPYWQGIAPVPTSEILSCKNGLLHMPTRRLLPHTPLFRNTYALDYDFDANAPDPPQWLAFLEQLWPHDAEAIESLQEMFGYLLTCDTSHQKIFLLIGPLRSGKGTIARILRAMLGEINVAGPTLASLGESFGLQPLINKPLAIISDARLGGKTDVQVIAERLLSISGEDALDVARKFIGVPWNGKLPTRFLILTNVLPKVTDASGALTSRFVILRLTESFYGKEDLALTGKLLKELPGILKWSLAGLDRLQPRGHFKMPETSKGILQAFESLSNPIGVFLEDRCIVNPVVRVQCDHLFFAWKTWCEGQGRAYSGSVQSFGSDLHAAIPGLKTTQPRTHDGKRYRCFEGVSLVEPEPKTKDTDTRKAF
jgi:putative DNA primase/helicase